MTVAYLLMILGLIFIAVTGKTVLRQGLEQKQQLNYQHGYFENLERRISRLEEEFNEIKISGTSDSLPDMGAKIEKLQQTLTGIENKLEGPAYNLVNQYDYQQEEQKTYVKQRQDGEVNYQIDNKKADDKVFTEYVKEAEHEDMFEMVREAYFSGKSVTDIARQFNKGKGEVELILSLRR